MTFTATDAAGNTGTGAATVTVNLSPLDVDDDNDGFTENQGDCDDTNASINPDAIDIPGNGIDENCDGQDAQEDVTPPTLTITSPGDGVEVTDFSIQVNGTATDETGKGSL